MLPVLLMSITKITYTVTNNIFVVDPSGIKSLIFLQPSFSELTTEHRKHLMIMSIHCSSNK